MAGVDWAGLGSYFWNGARPTAPDDVLERRRRQQMGGVPPDPLELARQQVFMQGRGPPTGPGYQGAAPPAPGLDSYAYPPPGTPASPSWFGPPQDTPAAPPPGPSGAFPGGPPVPVPRPARRPPKRPGDALAALPASSPAPQPVVASSPAAAGSLFGEASGYDPTAAYRGAANATTTGPVPPPDQWFRGGLQGDRQGPAERTFAGSSNLMDWLARRMGWGAR